MKITLYNMSARIPCAVYGIADAAVILPLAAANWSNLDGGRWVTGIRDGN